MSLMLQKHLSNVQSLSLTAQLSNTARASQCNEPWISLQAHAHPKCGYPAQVLELDHSARALAALIAPAPLALAGPDSQTWEGLASGPAGGRAAQLLALADKADGLLRDLYLGPDRTHPPSTVVKAAMEAAAGVTVVTWQPSAAGGQHLPPQAQSLWTAGRALVLSARQAAFTALNISGGGGANAASVASLSPPPSPPAPSGAAASSALATVVNGSPWRYVHDNGPAIYAAVQAMQAQEARCGSNP